MKLLVSAFAHHMILVRTLAPLSDSTTIILEKYKAFNPCIQSLT